MSTTYDLAIVGAGPAGMAAAVAASELKLSTVVLDEQPEPGGQIYRGIERLAAERSRHLDLLGPDYVAGLALAKAFRVHDYIVATAPSPWRLGSAEIALLDQLAEGTVRAALETGRVAAADSAAWMAARRSSRWLTGDVGSVCGMSVVRTRNVKATVNAISATAEASSSI